MIVEVVIIFIMMSHHHQINDAVIIKLMIVEKGLLQNFGESGWIEFSMENQVLSQFQCTFPFFMFLKFGWSSQKFGQESISDEKYSSGKR